MEGLYKIPIIVYRACLHVYFGSRDSCAEAMRAEKVSEKEIAEWLESTKGYEGMYHEENDFRLIWLSEVPTTIGKYADLSHEIEHAVFYLLNSRGLKHTEESDEAYAYLTSYFFEEIDSLIVSLREEDGQDNNTRQDTEQGEQL